MAAKTFLPNRDKERSIWLKNFSTKFASYYLLFGFVIADLNALAADSAAYAWILETIELFKTEAKERTSFKNILRNGPIGTTLGAYPSLPTLPAVPATAVTAGVFPRVSNLVKRIKAHPNYTKAIGEDLGVEGVDVDTFLSEEDKPVLTLSKNGGNVIVKYVKGNADGIHLYCKRGEETDFTLLAVVTKNAYKDTRPNKTAKQPETREYYAWFMKNDEITGTDSDTAEIVV